MFSNKRLLKIEYKNTTKQNDIHGETLPLHIILGSVHILENIL